VKPLRGAVAAMVLTLFMAQVSPVSAAPKPNDRCQKAGRERVTAAGTLRCQSVGGVLRWQLVEVSPGDDVSPGDYKVGDVGPGGGIVIYVARRMFASPGSDCASSCRYLEAAPAPSDGDPTLLWSSSAKRGLPFIQTATGIGSGMANTIAIVQQFKNSSTAAKYAFEYVNNGKGDWHLPSKDELNELWKQRAIFDYLWGTYWSSSQVAGYAVGVGYNMAWAQYFYVSINGLSRDGDQVRYYTNVGLGCNVRPVRAF